MHYVDEGPRDGGVVLLLHGEPTWSFLYRKMIPIIAKAGFRVLAPDLVGFGKSDKPASRNDYTLERHVAWTMSWLTKVNIKGITLFCQDWGGVIGLRLVAAKPQLFDRVVAGNTGLATGDYPMPDAFKQWQQYSREVPVFDVGTIMRLSTTQPFRINPGKPYPDEVIAAYDAPYPDESYKEGARIFPSLVPTTPDNPSTVANREAWKSLEAFTKPFLTAFSDNDAITHGGERILQGKIPGTKGQPHTTIKDAGHFLQEDKGEELAALVVEFIARTPA
jgi:haloalkane dehalogenase